MEDAPMIILLVVFAAVAIAAIVLSSAAAKRRREEMAALARELGWGCDDSHTSPRREHEPFDCFTRGHSRRASTTLTGSLEIGGRGYSALAGDYTYKVTRSNGKSTSTTTYRFSYLILTLPFGDTPGLVIRPETIMDKLAGAIGFDDIDFESEAFSRRFHVKGGDKKFAYDVVSPAMMEFLMHGMPAAIALDGRLCCLTDGRTRWDAGVFRTRIQWLRRFFELWPEYLTRQLGERSPAGGQA
jgi:hypothetical protein